MSEPWAELLGIDIAQVPTAIEDVWPVVDETGTVQAVVRTWDEDLYVQLDEAGGPVDDSVHTHHLMPRGIYQSCELPAEWNVVGVRILSRGASRDRWAEGREEKRFGDRRERDLLTAMNAGGASVIETIEERPPYTHIVEYQGDFYLAQLREAPAEAGPGSGREATEEQAAQVAAPAAPPAPAGPVAERAAAPQAPPPHPPVQAGAAVQPPAPEAAAPVAASADEAAPPEPAAAPAQTPEALEAAQAQAALAEALASEAAAEKAGQPGGAIPAVWDPDDSAPLKPPTTATMHQNDPLSAVVREPGSEGERGPSARAGGLSASLEEGIWEAEPDGPVTLAATFDPRAVEEEVRKATPEQREESLKRATEFFEEAAAAPRDAQAATGGLLTLEQVCATRQFAWDEYMNLYLPHVGFVAAVPARTPRAGAAADKVNFVSRPIGSLRPVGWHHLDGCECAICEGRRATQD